MESEAGVYHVLNRGNYRSAIFATDRTKIGFLQCLRETCERNGWIVHAWCLMSNHYHLAISTPRANLVDGMRWMQGTFAVRFNRLRDERGHIFQGRYKSLVVDPDEGLGPLCHYIHLNPVRAGLCRTPGLGTYRWTSMPWLLSPRLRPRWYDPGPALRHAGDLTDGLAGHRQYRAYLEWLAEDEPAQKRQRFDGMVTGWCIGAEEFTKSILRQHRELVGQGPRLAMEMQAAREAIWHDALAQVLRELGRTPAELTSAGKSAPWKLAAAAALKARSTAVNRWLAAHLQLGSRHEVGRKVAAWLRAPDPVLRKKLRLTPRPTA